MKKPELNVVTWLFSLLLFWVFVFFIQRQVFLLFHLGDIRHLPLKEVLTSNWYALSMDLSAGAYLVVLPLLVVSGMLLQRKHLRSMTFVHTINILLLFLTLLTGAFDTGLALQWGTKLNTLAFSYVDTSHEFTSLIFTKANLLLFITFVVLFTAFLFLYFLFFGKKILHINSRPLYTSFLVLCFGILLIAARGGLGKFPIDRSRVYFSVHSILNNAAVNGNWNLAEVLFTRKTLVNPYKHYDDRTVDKIYKRLFITPSDTSVSILTTRRPNIVLIIMESMCADVFSCLNGEKRITPGLDSITRQGLLFSNIYAAGSRTDQGLLAIFSGYPALPQQSVIRDFERICNLPHISSAFNKAGYHTSYIIGGNLEYENTRSYMLTGQTKLLIDGNDYPVDRKTNWGAYDEDLFHEHLKVADSLPQPFFSAISTITNHEEFEGDVPELWKRDKMVNRFRNTAHYTDHCIAAYLKDAIGHPWFKNTIFIIVADHGHRFPKNRKYNEPGKFHIPLIFFGDVLKPELKGKTVGQIGSQYDIPATLLGQLGLDRTGFTWGKDLLNPGSAEFAWYSFDHGFGYITPAGSIVYDYNLKKTVMQDNTLSPEQALLLTNEGKLFLQIFYDHYLESGKPTR